MTRSAGRLSSSIVLVLALLGTLRPVASGPSAPPAGAPSSEDAAAASLPSSGPAPAVSPAPARPEGVTVRYFVHIPNVAVEDARKLAGQQFDIAGFDAATGVLGIVATAEELDALSKMGLSYTVIDVSHPLDQGMFALSDYTDPTEMAAFLDQVQANFPTLAKKVLVKDSLFEGHTIWAMKITKDVDQPNDRPRFLLDAQHHAREVMTPEIAKDAIDFLTSNYASSAQVRNWVDNIEIWVVPIVNPDGAAYVFNTDNNWRKNRHPGCAVDNNRNYGFNWNACNGSSASCGAETTRGTGPESEPETQGMVQLFSDVHAFFGLSYHTYGQYLMYSYGCLDPDEKTVLDALAQSLNSVLVKDDGTAGGWATGPVWSTIYLADGGSLDTEYARYGTYSYVIEANSNSFQPDYATWRDITVQRQRTAWQFFLDKTLTTPQIRGKVTDALTGQPLAAQVSVQEVSYTHGESPRTADPRGLYNWLVQAGSTYHVSYSMPGYCTQVRTVTVGSGPQTVDVALMHPPAPSSPSAGAAGDNQIDLSWSPVATATEYHILRSLSSGGPYSLVATVPAPGTGYSDYPVSGGVTYYYVVRAFQACESPNSSEISAATTGACTLAPAFAGLASVTNAAASSCGLGLSWPGAAPYCGGPTTYRVYRSTSPSFTPSPATLIASGLSGTSYADHAALASGTTYYYIVRGVDASSGAGDSNMVVKSGVPTGPSSLGTWSDDAGDTGTAKMVLGTHWSVLPGGGYNGPKVYATGNYNNNMCTAITTPVLTLATNSTLSFNSKWDLETNYDAGEVEIATEPTFTNWTKLTTVNYLNTLANSGNACGFTSGPSEPAFSLTYTTPTYVHPYTGSLSAFNGLQVKLRFRISTDGGVTGKGWWVDDIAVTNVMIPGSCAAGPVPNPKEVSPAASPMTCSRVDGSSSVRLAYAPGCGTLDNAVYWGTGPITGAVSWTNAACAVGNTGEAVFDPGTPQAGDFLYFVMVGQNATKEGSYGQSFDGLSYAEIPEAVGIGACDKPRDLSGTCP